MATACRLIGILFLLAAIGSLTEGDHALAVFVSIVGTVVYLGAGHRRSCRRCGAYRTRRGRYCPVCGSG